MAFHADTYGDNLVVDHIDMKKGNNLPENLQLLIFLR
ncbi:HNH endonuclease [Chitinophaga sp. B61]|uniref:HNH endonuclease n=1 Tax=Chitinophaga rhizophila TaxID=2866212 RepID=A0ABS7GAI5_9BACT|nr:HNH endonuclease [Chitinophaga rhizophila]